jgi:flagellar biosynthesis protein FliQ
MSLLVLMVLLHVLAYEAIIRQYTLTFIHKLLNCVLYEFIYYSITIANISDFLHS